MTYQTSPLLLITLDVTTGWEESGIYDVMKQTYMQKGVKSGRVKAKWIVVSKKLNRKIEALGQLCGGPQSPRAIGLGDSFSYATAIKAAIDMAGMYKSTIIIHASHTRLNENTIDRLRKLRPNRYHGGALLYNPSASEELTKVTNVTSLQDYPVAIYSQCRLTRFFDLSSDEAMIREINTGKHKVFQSSDCL